MDYFILRIIALSDKNKERASKILEIPRVEINSKLLNLLCPDPAAQRHLCA
jgi:hypothetical protein